jgi:hypothetical protein
MLPSGGFFFCRLPTLALHGINSNSAGNYQLIDEESTRRICPRTISTELHFFSENFVETFSKAPFWLFWNFTFSFPEILTLNQNINSVSFRLFLTVHYVLRYIYISHFSTVRLAVHNFILPKTGFYDKKFRKFEPDKLASFCFLL